jgi:hypothetical protein
VNTFRDFSFSFYSDNDPRKIQVYTNIDLYIEYFEQYLNKEIAKKWLSEYGKLYNTIYERPFLNKIKEWLKV